MKKLVLHEPAVTAEDERLVLEALRSQWVSTGGPFIATFESNFAKYTGYEHTISTCNGTVALALAVEVLKRQKRLTSGFHVLVPTLTFAATWNSVFHAGGTPIPVDCASGSVNISIEACKAAITTNFILKDKKFVHRTSGLPLLAVMPAHILGWPAELAPLREWLTERQIGLLEDTAEALGTFDSQGNHIGKDGVAAVYSFNGNKILTTGGGGMLATNDAEFAKRAKHLATTAKSDNLRYVHDECGYNFRMVNILAAMGVSQLSSLPERLSKKSLIRDWYARGIEGSSAKLYGVPGVKANNWINTVIFPDNNTRERVMQGLLDDHVECRPLWTPFHRLAYAPKELLDQEYKFADQIWKCALSLPSSAHLEHNDVERICSTIRKLG